MLKTKYKTDAVLTANSTTNTNTSNTLSHKFLKTLKAFTQGYFGAQNKKKQ
jgi:hypothetical protein